MFLGIVCIVWYCVFGIVCIGYCVPWYCVYCVVLCVLGIGYCVYWVLGIWYWVLGGIGWYCVFSVTHIDIPTYLTVTAFKVYALGMSLE